MKHRLSLFLFSLSLIFSLGSLEKVAACTCPAEKSTCHVAGNSTAAFIGKAVGSKDPMTVLDPVAQKAVTIDMIEIYFEVEEAFSGVKKGERVTVHSGTGGGDCGYVFRRGETYLVYAHGKLERLGTNICSGTKLLSEAEQDLPVLRKLNRNNAGATLNGAINEEAGLTDYKAGNKFKPLSGLNVSLQPASGKGRIFRAKTDIKGEYKITGIPAGKYKVIADLPPWADSTQFNIDTSGFGCVHQWAATIENKNEVRGTVVDKNGKPIKAGVELISADSNFSIRPTSDIPNESDDTDETGAFSFSGLPAGRYFLAVNYTIDPYDTNPYPTVFYPAGKTPLQASSITVGRTSKIKGITFRLPAKLAEIKVSGNLVYSTGEPVKFFWVELIDVASGNWCVNCRRLTNGKGEFDFKGFETRKYRIVVSDKSLIKYLESPEFTLDKKTKPFNLTLDKPGDSKNIFE